MGESYNKFYSSTVSERPTKGEAFRVRGFFLETNSVTGLAASLISNNVVAISKDDNAFVKATNIWTPLPSSGTFNNPNGDLDLNPEGVAYLDLTAAEMNADTIILRFLVDRVGYNPDAAGYIEIKTTTGTSSGVTAKEVWEYATRTLTDGAGLFSDIIPDINAVPKHNPTLAEAISFLYRYFRLRRDRKWWNMRRFIERG